MMTFDQFLKEVCADFELDWRKFRRHAARRHLDEHLRRRGIPGYEPYIDLLRQEPDEAARLPDLLRVTVSRFFREREHWDFLAETVLPELLGSDAGSQPLKAWSVGCCNGEEPYSLQLLLLSKGWSGPAIVQGRDTEEDRPEVTGSVLPWQPRQAVDILATDIDEAVLERAREGCYGASSLREVPEDILERYFTRRGRQYQLVEEVRRRVTFKKHNLMSEEPPRGIGLLLCRYLVFTYYTGERRNEAARRLWQALAPGGVLMIGRKDHLGPRELEMFDPWPGSQVFFRRQD